MEGRSGALALVSSTAAILALIGLRVDPRVDNVRETTRFILDERRNSGHRRYRGGDASVVRLRRAARSAMATVTQVRIYFFAALRMPRLPRAMKPSRYRPPGIRISQNTRFQNRRAALSKPTSGRLS